MKSNLFALMIHVCPDSCGSLKSVLRRLGVDAFSVNSCEEATRLLEQTEPHLLFVDTILPDSTWVEVLSVAENAPRPLCPILIANSKDPAFRQTALAYGAFDCLEPPFDAESVSEVLQRAIRFVQASRERLARAAVA